MNVRCQNILARKCLKSKAAVVALSTSSRSSTPLTSDEVFSEKSRERCMSKIGKMKSMRPSNVPVTQRAAVLGDAFVHRECLPDNIFSSSGRCCRVPAPPLHPEVTGHVQPLGPGQLPGREEGRGGRGHYQDRAQVGGEVDLSRH